MNLKQELNNVINQKKYDDNLLNKVSKQKSKLVSQKTFNPANYNKLSEIEYSLYRYNS
mgnify:CR=1 FL=1